MVGAKGCTATVIVRTEREQEKNKERRAVARPRGSLICGGRVFFVSGVHW